MSDLISRQAAINAAIDAADDWDGGYSLSRRADMIERAINNLPSARPEVKEIGYAECANAMLKMWIDNVLTDDEYNRIMDRLNAHHNAERRQDG